MSSLCFVQGTPLSGVKNFRARTLPSVSFVCTLAPERKNREVSFRLLSEQTISSSLYPSPARHHSIPVIGYFVEHLLRLKPMVYDKVKKYGPIFSSNYMLKEMVHIADYDTIIEISRAPELFKCKGSFEGGEAMFPGNGLALDGADHVEFRSIVSPAFSRTLLSCYYPVVQKLTNQLFENLTDVFSKNENQRITSESFFRKHYLDTIIELSSGIKVTDGKAARICELFKPLSQGMVTYQFGPLGKEAYDAKAELREILRNIVLNCVRDQGEMIDRLRAHGDDLDGQEIREMRKNGLNLLHVFIAMSSLSTEPDANHDDVVVNKLADSISGIYLAGYLTSASTSTTGLLQLGLYPDTWQRLKEEQERVIARNGGAREVTYQQVMREMPLLDSFLSEVMRLYPPVPGALRIATEDVKILGRYIPKGSLLRLCYGSAHRDEKLYKNAQEFVFDRFAQGEKVPTTLSFGAPGSVHFCVGYALARMQLNCTFATMLREYNFELCETQSREFRYLPEVKPKSGTVLSGFSKAF